MRTATTSLLASNQRCDKFDYANCSVDDFKVLIFVKGYNKPEDSLALEKLLTKMDDIEANRAAAADPNTVPRMNLNDAAAFAERLSALKIDKSMVQQPDVKHEILQTHRQSKNQQQRQAKSSSNRSDDLPPTNCHFCGELHWHSECKFKEKDCHDCKKKGHKAGFCKSAADFLQRSSNKRSNNKRNSERRRSLAINAHSVSTRKYVEPLIGESQHKVCLQLDSGSDWTIISAENWKQIGSPELSNCEEHAISASGNQLDMCGKFSAKLRLHGREGFGQIYVTNHNLNVLGSDWMEALNLWAVPIANVCNSIRQGAAAAIEQEAKSKFPDLFNDSLGLCIDQASLQLKPNAKPIFRNARPVAFAAAEPIENELKRLQHLGVITPVRHSEYAAPIVAVKKKDGRVRICADYSTGLNDSLEPEQFPLPTPDDIFAQLAPFKVFSKIDLSDAFLQIELDDDSKRLMTINTHCGLFQVNRLQPGVKPAPGIFQKLVTKMMSGAKGVFPFIDDFIVGGTDETDHKHNLFDALQRIQDFGFHLKIDKCSFAQDQLDFLGHIINSNGIKPGPEKLAVLQKLPAPTNVQQLQAFLGAVTWYQKFVPNIKQLRGPLDELLSEGTDFGWLTMHEEAFRGLKQVLQSDLALVHYDPTKKLIVAADASSYGIGAVLLHEIPNGDKKPTLKPIIHAARAFTAAEKNYPQIQREALALTFALQKFHRYVYGRKFELQTDHQPLLAIFGNKKGIPVHTASRLQRYALILLAYDFNIRYVNTKSFAYADFVSRLISDHQKPDEEVVIGSTVIEKNILTPSALVTVNAKKVKKSALGKSFVKANVKNENAPENSNSDLSEGKLFAHIIADITATCFAIDTARTLQTITYDAIKVETNNDEALKQVTGFINNGWPSERQQIINAEAAQFHARRETLFAIDGCIFFGDRIVVPSRYRNEILKELHQGHPGAERMKQLARQKVFWPSIDNDIEKTVRCCDDCATGGFSPIKATLKPWPIPSAPWDRIHIDFAGPINGFWFLIIVDAFSKWPEIFKMQSTTSQLTTDRLEETFARHGLCQTIVSDNGPQFTSEHFKSFCDERGIKHITTAPFHPQSNGQAERFVQTFKQGLKKLAGEGNVNEILRKFLFCYRYTPSYNLGSKSPHELMTGRQMRTKLDLLKPQVNTTTERQSKMEQQFNEHHGAKAKEFEIGDKVFVKQHSANNKWRWVSGEILRKRGAVMYYVQTDERIVSAHANQLKRRFTFIGNDNVLLEAFDISFPTHAEIEPEIVPEPQPESDDDSFEDAVESQEDDSDGETQQESEEEEVPAPAPRPQRSTAGNLPSKYRDYVMTR